MSSSPFEDFDKKPQKYTSIHQMGCLILISLIIFFSYYTFIDVSLSLT